MRDKEILLKAIDTARAWSSMIVTLSTGGIVLTAIFRRDFAAGGAPLEQEWLLLATWAALAAGAVAGVGFLSALTAILSTGNVDRLDLYNGAVRWIAIVQLVVFVAGVICFVVFASINL